MVGACNACGKIDAAQIGSAWSDHTEQQKFNGLINDCSSRKVTDLFCAIDGLICESFLKASCLTKTNSICANCRVV